LKIDAMSRSRQKYDVDGVHFDYIRYPDREHCFCGGCRKRFEEYAGMEMTSWPMQIRQDETIERRWQQFRRQQITDVVAAVAEQARQVRPGVKISAAYPQLGGGAG